MNPTIKKFHVSNAATVVHRPIRLLPRAFAACVFAWIALTTLVVLTTSSCVVDVNPIELKGVPKKGGASKDTHAPSSGSNAGNGDQATTPPPPPPAPTMKIATRDTVVWKRQRALENDLMRALSLSKDQVCNEVGTFACIDQAHLAALGGNEPFELTQYTPVPAPTVTTPFALERVVLSACSTRAELDAAAPADQRVVFTAFDLAPAATVDAASLDALDTSLFHAFLARDPKPEELASLQSLREQNTSALDVAKLACFTIGTSIEFAFN